MIASPKTVSTVLDLPLEGDPGQNTDPGTTGGTTAPPDSPGGGIDLAGIGQALYKVGEWLVRLGGILPKGTQHMDWDTANAQATAFASKVLAAIKTKWSDPATVEKIGEQYRKNMIAFVNTIRSTRWGEGNPENTDQFLAGMARLAGGDPRTKVYIVTWFWAMWTLRNSDLNNPDEWINYSTFDMNHTLFPAITTVTGTVIPPTSFTTPTGTKTTLGSADIFGSLSGSIGTLLGSGTDIVMLLIIGGVIFFIWKGLGK